MQLGNNKSKLVKVLKKFKKQRRITKKLLRSKQFRLFLKRANNYPRSSLFQKGGSKWLNLRTKKRI